MRTGLVLAPTRYPANLFGKDNGAWDRLKPLFLMRVAPQLSTGNQPFPWVHMQDVCGLYSHVLANENISGPVNVVAPEHITQGQFRQVCVFFSLLLSLFFNPSTHLSISFLCLSVSQTIARTFNRSQLPIVTPAFLLNTIYGRNRAELLYDGQKVEPKKALDTGYKFAFSTMEECAKDLCTFEDEEAWVKARADRYLVIPKAR
jgi:NAD dependent epimerase/dehydratase family enzyme